MQARHTEAGLGSRSLSRSNRRPQGAASADLRLNCAFRVLVVDIAAHGTSIHSFGSEEYSIARLVAVGLAIMLSMPAWGQCLGAALAAQAGPVPVLTQGGHLLGEVHSLVASRTHVGLPSERGDTGGFAGTLGGPAGLPLFSSHHRDLDGASDLRALRRRLLVDVGTSTPDIHTFGSKQRSITGLVAERFPIMLSMAARRQCLVAALTLEAELVPVLTQGAHLLGYLDLVLQNPCLALTVRLLTPLPLPTEPGRVPLPREKPLIFSTR